MIIIYIYIMIIIYIHNKKNIYIYRIFIANAAWSYDNPTDRLEMKECVTFATEKSIKLSFEK
jgi:hypothetical protein